MCGSDESKWKEATTAAVDAINARERFWDSIAQCIRKKVKQGKILETLLVLLCVLVALLILFLRTGMRKFI